MRDNEFNRLFDECLYTVKTLSIISGASESSLRGWMNGATPQKANLETYRKVIATMTKDTRIKKHPSYGYATPEQIEKLKVLGIGPDRDMVLKQIMKQAKKKGKK